MGSKSEPMRGLYPTRIARKGFAVNDYALSVAFFLVEALGLFVAIIALINDLNNRNR